MSKFHFQPIKEKADEILKAILQTPELASCSTKDVMVIRLACEEVVVNITSYAYPDDAEDYLDLEIEAVNERIMLRFIDGGTPFNPFEHEMPDTTQSWEERRIGGLGIFLIFKKMDDVRYAYENNQNILTIEKIINQNR
ncbi:MAG: ATP-binding protein [Prevotella sp.]|nr:ATP-binding protein [Prevotella sp.]